MCSSSPQSCSLRCAARGPRENTHSLKPAGLDKVAEKIKIFTAFCVVVLGKTLKHFAKYYVSRHGVVIK